jgi:hypothetical protein
MIFSGENFNALTNGVPDSDFTASAAVAGCTASSNAAIQALLHFSLYPNTIKYVPICNANY